jgi:VCBS repeat protein
MKGLNKTLVRLGSVAASTLMTLLAVLAPARAMPPIGEDPPESCLDDVWAEFYASPGTVTLGQSTTLRWNVETNGCTVTLGLGGVGNVSRTGSRVVTPGYSHWYTLTARRNAMAKTFYAWAAVDLPRDVWGRINVTITSNDQVGLFIQAITSEPNAVVSIQSNVSLDLSYYTELHIQPGVQILGGRSSSNPGPLIFTNTYPGRLFIIGEYFDADNVRISGIRLQGADQSVAEEESPSSIGIWINSSLNVEIDNSEILGWHVAGISVHDNRARIDRGNGRGAVRIHDNFIHRNQRIGEGYGVEVSGGAYALVEKNHFAENRHSIAGDGSYGDGYFFYRNFVSETGGHHEVIFGIDTQTHQIDMHGQQEWCWLWWCVNGYRGVAGEYMDVRHNAILYDAGTAIKVRGTPTVRMDVAYNKFAHEDVWGSWSSSGAMQQTDGEGAFNQWGNTFGGRGNTGFASVCDFDGDGILDTFSANGATWLYSSGAAGQTGLHYLNTSTLFADEVDFLDVNGDGLCDVRVRADGRVSLGGRTPLTRVARTDLLSAIPGQVRIARLEGGVITGQAVAPFRPDQDVVATGDFDGDGDADILLRDRNVLPRPSGQGGYRPTRILWVQNGALAGEAFWGVSPAGGGVKGVADFDGDGADDVLWRDENGMLKLWYWGVGTDITPSWRNWGGVVGSDWDVKAVGDFNGDGYADIAWRHDSGQVSIWVMVGSIYIGEFYPGGPDPGLTWTIQGAGDFDGDGRSDLLWRYLDGSLAIWFGGSNTSTAYPSWRNLGTPSDLSWQIKGLSDFNRDGRTDILWQRTDGLVSVWLMQGGAWAGEIPVFFLDPAWPIQGLLPVW